VFRFVPVRGELVGGADDDGAPFEGEWLAWLQPGPKRLFRKLESCAIEKAGPDFGRRERHGLMWITWKAGERSYSGPDEIANPADARVGRTRQRVDHPLGDNVTCLDLSLCLN
jgi:hypothetical protein